MRSILFVVLCILIVATVIVYFAIGMQNQAEWGVRNAGGIRLEGCQPNRHQARSTELPSIQPLFQRNLES
jgi:hypothetical protein